MQTRSYRYLDLITASFVAVLLISNIASTKFLTLGPFTFDGGTILFPLAYIFGDVLTEVYGFRRARRVIWTGFLAMVLMGIFVWLAGVLPGEAIWESYAGQSAYDAILGGISGLIVASLIAYLAGEFSNSYVLARMKVASKGRWLPARTIGSTLVGQAVDTVAFIGVATALGVFHPDQFLGLVVTNYIFKVGIEVIMTPITIIIINWLKKAENEDYYDHNTQFNPFRINS